MRHRNKVIQGSQGSSKTTSVLQRWALLAVKSKNRQLCTTVTDTLTRLRTGALKDFVEMCDREKINYTGTKSPFVYKINKWTFEFYGIDKESKGLGARRDRLFINEANRLNWKVARPLIGRTHVERLMDFNPSTRFWAHEQYVQTGDCDFVKLTYKDNEYLPDSEREDIERYAPDGIMPDPNYWRVYGLGEIGFVENVIFGNYQEYESLPEGTKFANMIGVDFGWNDALTSVMVHIDRKNKRIYWREMFYASEASYDDFAAVIKNDNEYNGCPLICDHEPRDIRSLRNRGLRAIACDKSSGLTADIRSLKQYQMFIHKDSENLKLELSMYRWQEKNGHIIDYPEDKNNHCIDAGRYASIILMNIS